MLFLVGGLVGGAVIAGLAWLSGENGDPSPKETRDASTVTNEREPHSLARRRQSIWRKLGRAIARLGKATVQFIAAVVRAAQPELVNLCARRIVDASQRALSTGEQPLPAPS